MHVYEKTKQKLIVRQQAALFGFVNRQSFPVCFTCRRYKLHAYNPGQVDIEVPLKVFVWTNDSLVSRSGLVISGLLWIIQIIA